jgi:hypothetical protein
MVQLVFFVRALDTVQILERMQEKITATIFAQLFSHQILFYDFVHLLTIFHGTKRANNTKNWNHVVLFHLTQGKMNYTEFYSLPPPLAYQQKNHLTAEQI